MYVEKRARNDQAIDKDINRGCVGSADVHGASVRGTSTCTYTLYV